MNETPQIGMDQLAYFARMMKYYLDPDQSAHFWSKIRENCPDLMQMMDTFDQPLPFTVMRKVTFTWDLHSPAFDPCLAFGNEDQPEQKKQLPEQLEPEQESRI